MPSPVEIPCAESGDWPGHAGIDGHAALHLNPLPNYTHGGHTLCLQLSSPFDH